MNLRIEILYSDCEEGMAIEKWHGIVLNHIEHILNWLEIAPQFLSDLKSLDPRFMPIETQVMLLASIRAHEYEILFTICPNLMPLLTIGVTEPIFVDLLFIRVNSQYARHNIHTRSKEV